MQINKVRSSIVVLVQTYFLNCKQSKKERRSENIDGLNVDAWGSSSKKAFWSHAIMMNISRRPSIIKIWKDHYSGHHRCIFCKKKYFFPTGWKNCEKVSPYFSLSGVEKCPNLHFFGEKLSRFTLFWKKFDKIGTF